MAEDLVFIALKDLPISRGTAYRLAKSGLRIVRLGRHAGVLKRDWEKFLTSLPSLACEHSTRHAAAAAARWRKAREQKSDKHSAQI